MEPPQATVQTRLHEGLEGGTGRLQLLDTGCMCDRLELGTEETVLGLASGIRYGGFFLESRLCIIEDGGRRPAAEIRYRPHAAILREAHGMDSYGRGCRGQRRGPWKKGLAKRELTLERTGRNRV